jgi:hypothetical protein
MYRIDHFTGTQTLEAPTAPNTNEGIYFTGGTPGVGGVGQIIATVVEPEWLNMIQEELCNVVEFIEPLDKSDRAQLRRCIIEIGNPGGGGGGGPNMFEPPDIGKPYGRYYDGTSGEWRRAIEEPEREDGRGYSRTRPTMGMPGEWVAVSGYGRAQGPMSFYVRRDGDNTNSGLTEADAWEDIQFAVDEITAALDAGGHVITIDVGDDEGPPWDGFAVTQPLLNAPRMGFKIVGKSVTGDRDRCKIGPCPLPEYAKYCVYAEGTRVCISDFLFPAGPGTGEVARDNGSATICAHGNDTTLWLEKDICFLAHRENAPCLLSTQGALMIVDEQIIFQAIDANGYFGPGADAPGSGVPQTVGDTYKGLMASDFCGQIIFEDTRNGDFDVVKPRATILGVGAPANLQTRPGFRFMYVNRGGIIDMQDEAIWVGARNGGGVVLKGTGVINVGTRSIWRSNTGAAQTYAGVIVNSIDGVGSEKVSGGTTRSNLSTGYANVNQPGGGSPP